MCSAINTETHLIHMEKDTYIFVLSGLDPSGKAGFVRDIATITAIGSYAGGVITALTVQDFHSGYGFVPVDPQTLRRQVETVWEQKIPDAVKIGMVPNLQVAETIAEILKKFRRRKNFFVVWDPVLASSDSFPLTEEDQIGQISSALSPEIDLLTPNLPEFRRLFGIAPEDKNIVAALEKFHIRGLILKGGHSDGDTATDILIFGEKTVKFSRPKIEKTPRGTGCTFSSALATFYAIHRDITRAFLETERFMEQFLRSFCGGNLS